ncbi:hypothetical protein ACLE20_00930 [Rhizobium sp. YIM 134829]|uniref:rhamnosyltransferase WsaF family glycosyltransferase n=1 Tax=Rhizobium sp. YIM 134829 TaxID=3390453 RepID=UPI00397CCCAE
MSKFFSRKAFSSMVVRAVGSSDLPIRKQPSSEVDLIVSSGCFDENWYRERHKVEGSGQRAAVEHYIKHAFETGVAPHPLFNTPYYQASVTPSDQKGLSPLAHYLTYGIERGASPHPLFDPAWYRIQAKDLAANEDPFRHFLHHGAKKLLSPHPLVLPAFYLEQRASLQHSGANALTHFVECGYREGLWPNPYFDVSWYMLTNGKQWDHSVNPLVHFIDHSEQVGLDPHPELDIDKIRTQEVFAGLSRLEILTKIIHDERLRTIFTVSKPNDMFVIIGLNRIPHPSTLDAVDGDAITNLFEDADASTDDASLPPPEVGSIGIDIRSEASLVSFDVWDTLVRRDCHPDEIKLQSARALYLIAYPYLLPVFKDVRVLLEARRVSENRSAPNDEYEYRFDDALQRWLAMVTVPGIPESVSERILSAMQAHEYLSETRSTRPDANAKACLEKLQQTAVFASDFYLPSGFLKTLLSHHGLGHHFLQGFSSSDAYLTKRSGRMFDHILQNFGIPPEQLHHVGDNREADQRVPESKAISSFLYLSPAEEERKSWYGKAFHAWLQGGPDLHAQRLRRITQDVANSVGPGELARLERIGAKLAPIVFGYCLSILEDALRSDAKTVFFFTREGVFFRDVFDRIVAENPFNLHNVRSEVLDVSRRATFAASLRNLSFGELMRLWNLYSIQSLKGFASSLNLDLAVIASFGSRHKIDFEAPIEYPWLDKRVKDLFNDKAFKTYVEGEISQQRDNLKGYLANKGFFENPVQLVSDIGWRGTIQDNLAYLAPEITTRGHYLGLFGFLNQQPDNTEKFGFVFDANRDDPLSVSDVGPLEMIFNVPGGSVVGYRQEGDSYHPLRSIFEDEEAVMKEVGALQRGMLRALGPLCDYVRLHGLSAADLTRLSKETIATLIKQPPLEIVDLFYRLHHNETFGLGEVKNMGDSHKNASALTQLKGSALHKAVNDIVTGTRWPEASVRQAPLRTWWEQTDEARRLAAPAEVTALHMPPTIRTRGAGVAVYVPPPIRGSGGHRTIYNLVRRLSELGLQPEIMLEGVGDGIQVVEDYLAGTPALLHTRWHRRINVDVAFATVAHSAAYVADLVQVPHKAYLVQDYEALFNPMSDGFIVCQNSYAMGLQHVTIGNWLSHVIATEYAAPSIGAGLGVDTSVYFRDETIKREQAICFLYQPNKPRRTPRLGIEALRLLKQKRPELTIYVYGSDESIDPGFPVINLGMISDLKELNALYNRCAVGLCISATNPSRIPYEMMAAGCVPIDLYRYNNLLDYDPGSILLAYQDSASLAEAADSLLREPKTLKRMSKNGITFAASRTLRWENDVIANGVLNMLEGKNLPAWTRDLFYDAQPIIADSSSTTAVLAFCRAQREKAV